MSSFVSSVIGHCCWSLLIASVLFCIYISPVQSFKLPPTPYQQQHNVLEKYQNDENAEIEVPWTLEEKNYGEFCVKSSDCKNSSHLICDTDGKCACKPSNASIFDEILQACVILSGQICTPHQNWCVKNSECDQNKKVCVCMSGFLESEGKCESEQEPEEDSDYDDGVNVGEKELETSSTLNQYELTESVIAQQKKPISANEYDDGGNDEELFPQGGDEQIPAPIVTTQRSQLVEKSDSQVEREFGGDISVSTLAYSDTDPNLQIKSSSNEDQTPLPPYLPVPLLEIPKPVQAPATESNHHVNDNDRESVESVTISTVIQPVTTTRSSQEIAVISWPTLVEQSSSSTMIDKESVKLGDMCNNQDEVLSCGMNAVCQEIGNSSDFMCVCSRGFMVQADSDMDCVLNTEVVKKDEIDDSHHEKDQPDDKNTNIITPAVLPTLNQNTILELEEKPLRELLRVGESCIPPSTEESGWIEKNSLRNPEIGMSCVQDAECVAGTSIFQEFNICQCREGYTKTAKGKCTNYPARNVDKTSSSADSIFLYKELAWTLLYFTLLNNMRNFV